MQIIRLTTWIGAPAERCFRLATSAEFHSVLAKLSRRGAPEGTALMLSVGDRLIWPGHYLGLQLRYTTRIDLLRPPGYFREMLYEGYLRHFEHEHHFTPLNDGTRVRDELRFVPLQGLFGSMTTRLVRRYLVSRVLLRNQILKSAAESGAWKGYLEEPPSRVENGGRTEASKGKSDSAARISGGHMAAHRG